jgi:hypothetical protein
MATKPQFAYTVATKRVQCTAAYTDRSGATAGLVDLVTGAAATTGNPGGTKITKIVAKAAGNSSIGNLLIFLTDASGANPRLYDEIGFVAAVTASNTAASSRAVLLDDDLQLEPGQKIQVGFTVLAAGPVPVNVFAIGGDLLGT